MSKKVSKMGWIVLATFLSLSLAILPACGDAGPALPSEYIGSGALDGHGIPVDFFSDLNVRKGMCYAFDYNTYITQALLGQGTQRGSPVVYGLYGFNPSASMYSYNLTQAKYYFEHSSWGNLTAIGFKFTLLYNVGNLPRKTACELLAEGLYRVSPNFQVSVQPLAWPTILSKIFGTRDMPLYQIGWQADYAHADNFIVPFMHSQGVYSYWQGYGSSALDDLIADAFEETDPGAQLTKYYDLQQRYYDDAPGIALAQPLVRRYFTGHISGFLYNPVDPSYPCQVMDLTKSQNFSSGIPYLHAGQFIEDTISELDSLDPAWGYDTASGQQVQYIYDTLLWYNGSSTDTFVPRLATNLGTFNATDNTMRFTIRSGVQFSNGHNLTPVDVEYSFERAMTQDRPAGPVWMLFAPLTGGMFYEDTNWAAINQSVEVDGQDVVFKLVGAWWELPFRQIVAGAWASIVDKDYCVTQGDWDGTEADIVNHLHPANNGDTALFDDAMGTGPWKLDQWQHGIQIKVDRNTLYWGGNETIPFDNIITKSVDVWNTRKLDLLAGEADLVYVPATQFNEMDAVSGLNVWRYLPALSFDAFFFNMIIGGPEEE
ncbi:MAG: ABC transporter substrate-binding protein [Dehalococcoidia bacterium]|nr:ABC transporter substrate-binding protein [Dehalococcoidia bacterium]